MNIFRRVDEFSEHGDLDMMMQYVKDVQAVQRKLVDCTDSITFINEVHMEVLNSRAVKQHNVCWRMNIISFSNCM